MAAVGMFRIIVTLCLVIQLTLAENVEVFTRNGPVVGKKLYGFEKQSNAFFGIPYAKPPVGKLRFRKPVPTDKWTEPLEAFQYSSNCYQVHSLQLNPKFMYNSTHSSEDCLYLNIWSPDVTVDENNLQPVLVFIHGGGLQFGSASLKGYNGQLLSEKSNSVVVSINYR